MKKLHVLVLGLCLAGLLVPAAEAKNKKNGGEPADVLATFDKNGDGQIDVDEKGALSKAYEELKAFDTNKDGTLSDDEVATLHFQTPVKHKKKNK